MYNHAPTGYDCPFCCLISGKVDPIYSRPTDIVFQDEAVTAFISSHFWENNHGNVVIIPNQHYEHIYDLPDSVGAQIFSTARRIACAMKKTYHCDGTSTRQHNEPAGNQEVFHFHFHVFPRYAGDQLYTSTRFLADPGERAKFANQLREALV